MNDKTITLSQKFIPFEQWGLSDRIEMIEELLSVYDIAFHYFDKTMLGEKTHHYTFKYNDTWEVFLNVSLCQYFVIGLEGTVRYSSQSIDDVLDKIEFDF